MLRSLAAVPRRAALRVPVSRVFTSSASAPSSGDYKHLTQSLDGAALTITMARPSLHNAFNEDVIAELTSAFRSVSAAVTAHAAAHPVADATAPVPRVVILKGDGPSFSAGADLNWMSKMAKYSEEENRQDSLALYDMFHAIHACPVPVIARVHGAALGGGCGLVAACDVAFAHKDTKFGFTEVGLGLIPAVISPFCIGKIGGAHAARFFVTGERFEGQTAKDIGLVSDVFASEEELDAAVAGAVKKIASNSPAAVRAAKQLVKDVTQKGMTLDKDETRTFVTGAIAAIRVSPEGQAGLRAFLDKGKAPWVLPSAKKA